MCIGQIKPTQEIISAKAITEVSSDTDTGMKLITAVSSDIDTGIELTCLPLDPVHKEFSELLLKPL